MAGRAQKGPTVLSDIVSELCNGMRIVVAHDKTGKALHHGCWFQHGQSVVVLWDKGVARAVPVSAVTWEEDKPKQAKPKREDGV
jgi:hypothetical protein